MALQTRHPAVASVKQPEAAGIQPSTQSKLSPTLGAVHPAASELHPVRAVKVEGGAQFPAAPSFIETSAGHYQARGTRYSASLSAYDGLAYQALDESGKSRGDLKVRFKSAVRGEETLFKQREDAPAKVERGLKGLQFWRGSGFKECYEPRGHGVEQLFVFDQQPSGKGDLEFTFDLSLAGLTPLPARLNRAGGIHFVDSRGQSAACYGQAVIRDANGHGIVANPHVDASGTQVSFSVSGRWLERARYPVSVDPLVGQDIQVSLDNTLGVAQPVGAPTVAAGISNYLIVWNDFSAGAALPQIFGAILTETGILSLPIALSSTTGVPRDYTGQRIETTFDGTNWLVVWSDDRATGFGVRGAIVSPAGQLLGGTDFLVAPTAGTVEEKPLVSYNGTDYIVAWTDSAVTAATTTTTGTGKGAGKGSAQIFYKRISVSGVVDQNAFTVPPQNAAKSNEELLFLSAQKPSGDTLLIYHEVNERPSIFRSVRITPNGTMRDSSTDAPGGVALFYENPSEQGFGQPIGVAFTGGQWNILSSFSQLEDSAVYLHKLSPAGVVTPPSGVFAAVGLGPTGLTENKVSVDTFAPVFAGGGEWLFVRNERVNGGEFHILGKRVTFDGVDKDPVPFQIDASTRGVLRSAVAAGGATNFCVAWLDGRRGTTPSADSQNIFAALVDLTEPGLTNTPLVAVASASPASGEPPLSVHFDALASTGNFSTLNWDFGDGTTSTVAAPTHIYKSAGIFVARLALTQGSYSVFDTVIISVGQGSFGRPQRIGTPIANSPDMQPGLQIRSAQLSLDFTSANNDAFTFIGTLDTSGLPDNVTALPASISLGDAPQQFTQAFNMDVGGGFASNMTVKPVLHFDMDPFTGDFVYEGASANLQPVVGPLGGANETISNPARIVKVPLTVTLGGVGVSSSVTASAGLSYTAKVNDRGVGVYAFFGVGAEVTGSLPFSSFTAKESGKKGGPKAHQFTVKGRLVKPEGTDMTPALSGQFRFFIGNASYSADVAQIAQQKGKLSFSSKSTAFGLKKMSLDINTGLFSLQFVAVPATGANSSGLPLAKSGTNVTQVNLNFSLSFDLIDNQTLSAGRYAWITRKNSATTSWALHK